MLFFSVLLHHCSFSLFLACIADPALCRPPACYHSTPLRRPDDTRDCSSFPVDIPSADRAVPLKRCGECIVWRWRGFLRVRGGVP